MDRIRIVGGNPLNGVIPISGAKNAALPLMIASLLTDDTLTLENLPHLADVEQLQRILGNHGVDIAVVGRRERQDSAYARTVHFTARTIVDTTAPYELVSKMRASFWVIGPLLARMGEAKVSLPGGCAIGTRPVDLFIDGLQHLGAEINIENGYVDARAPKGLVGGRYVFPKVSVGATHVMLMAATLAKGQTVIENAAREPEVADLAKCLIAMGAKISGAGTSTITIDGVASLSGARHKVLPDRIETGTYAMAVAMTGGDVLLENTSMDLLESALLALSRAGVGDHSEGGIRVRRNGGDILPVDITTDPFPGFPTDLQAQFMGLDDARQRHLAHHRNDLREPLHACPGTGAPGSEDLAVGSDRHSYRRAGAARRPGDGNRPARFRVAGDRRSRRRRRDGGQPGLPSRSWLRAARREADQLWRRGRTDQRLTIPRAAGRMLPCGKRKRHLVPHCALALGAPTLHCSTRLQANGRMKMIRGFYGQSQTDRA
jgi:UDP-N-acetylglucosamine 1-carboxyvinyltransferase